MPRLKNPPVPTTTGKSLAKLGKGDVRLIQVLKDDFDYDVIQEIITMIGIIKRGKKLKPLEKYRLIQSYQLALLSYCVPKMKVVEGERGVGDKVNFTINVGGDTTEPVVKKSGAGVNITIPTVRNKSGQFVPDPK